ncbi:MAG: protein-export chaperone SecB [Betaproteobacteria bacterium]|jgi:preprotein translocase subunit SecB|nr:protein-export chaperone SecB [Betaproteobacteria bacterium]
MTDNTQATDNPPVFAIEKIYVKDLSLEVPNAPQIFLVREAPQVNVQLRTEGSPVEAGVYEVKLTITVAATLSGERTLFLVEITQAGIFRIQNAPEEELELILGIGCPNIIFPYARETISDAVTRAGFQPMLLAPVNFEALFQQSRQDAGIAQNQPMQ